MRNICIKNLPAGMNENGLAILCRRFGEVNKCAIMRDKKGKSRCIAMVAFSTSEEASLAISSLDHCCVDASGEICNDHDILDDICAKLQVDQNKRLEDQSRSILIAVSAMKDPLTDEEIQARAARVREMKDRNKQMNRANQADHQEIRLKRLQALSFIRLRHRKTS